MRGCRTGNTGVDFSSWRKHCLDDAFDGELLAVGYVEFVKGNSQLRLGVSLGPRLRCRDMSNQLRPLGNQGPIGELEATGGLYLHRVALLQFAGVECLVDLHRKSSMTSRRWCSLGRNR